MTVYETAINLLSGYEPIGLLSRNKRDGLFYLIKNRIPISIKNQYPEFLFIHMNKTFYFFVKA